jgi:hypothetical protein
MGRNPQIIIDLGEAKKPPKVIVNGQEWKVVKLKYKYETVTDESLGVNNLYAEVINPNVPGQITIIGFKSL